MRILRIFIGQEDLSLINWQLIENNLIADSGSSSLTELLLATVDPIEIYLAPSLATVIPIDLGEISDRKINDELLLGLVEESLAEEIEACKPILLRLNDGVAYVAIVSRHFYQLLLEKLVNNVKQVRFIQPFAYLVKQEADIWTLYLNGKDKFLRTSAYEYFILDDGSPLPELLEQMLKNYTSPTLALYSDDPELALLITAKYNLSCKTYTELNYGVLTWNFYNEKSKRFNLKVNPATRRSLISLAGVAGIFMVVFIGYWLLNLGFMMYQQQRLQNQVNQDLAGIVASSQFTPNLLAQVDDKLSALEHDKGIYAASDMASLVDVFLKSMPDVSNHMIQGINYSANELVVFLSSQFQPSGFVNDQAILASKRINATLQDYKSYAASLSAATKNNNGAGVLSNTSSASSSAAMLQDAAWVVRLQIISRMDNLNENSVK